MLARATLNGLAGRLVARGPPVAQLCFSLYSIFPKCMISCVVVFDGRVTRFVYDAKHQWLLAAYVKFSQTVVVVLKNSFPN